MDVTYEASQTKPAAWSSTALRVVRAVNERAKPAPRPGRHPVRA